MRGMTDLDVEQPPCCNVYKKVCYGCCLRVHTFTLQGTLPRSKGGYNPSFRLTKRNGHRDLFDLAERWMSEICW